MKQIALTVGFASIMAFSVLLTGCGQSQDAQAVADLQAMVDNLRSQLDEYSENDPTSELQSQLDTLASEKEGLQSQLDAFASEKEGLSSKLEAIYSIEPMDETMYVTSEVKLYDDLYGAALGDESKGTLQAGQEVKVTGKSKVIDWYKIEVGGEDNIDIVCAFIDGQYLSEYTKPAEQTTAENQGNSQNSQNQGNGNLGNNQSQGNQNQGNGGNGNGNQNQQQQPPQNNGESSGDHAGGGYIREDGVYIMPDGREVRTGDTGAGGSKVYINNNGVW